MADEKISRRKLMRDTAAAAAGITAGLAAAKQTSAAEAKAAPAAKEPAKSKTKTRSYNENMEYRRLGRTELWISAVSIGGHWKKIADRGGSAGFKKNRAEVMAACIDHGINYIDACWNQEVTTYAAALGKNRQKMYFGCSNGAFETRYRNWANSLDKMKEGFERGLKASKLEYVDLWRITMHEQTSRRNTKKEIEIAMQAYKRPAQKIPRVRGHHQDWLNAIRKGKQAGSNFDYGAPLTELALLGLIAIRHTGTKLLWDGKAAKFTNSRSANALLDPPYRKGWTL